MSNPTICCQNSSDLPDIDWSWSSFWVITSIRYRYIHTYTFLFPRGLKTLTGMMAQGKYFKFVTSTISRPIIPIPSSAVVPFIRCHKKWVMLILVLIYDRTTGCQTVYNATELHDTLCFAWDGFISFSASSINISLEYSHRPNSFSEVFITFGALSLLVTWM